MEEKEKKKPHSWRDKSLVLHIITYFVLLFGTFTVLYSILLYIETAEKKGQPFFLNSLIILIEHLLHQHCEQHNHKSILNMFIA